MPGPAGDFSGLIDTEPIRSLDRVIRTNAQRDPDAACIISDAGERLTWRQLAIRSSKHVRPCAHSDSTRMIVSPLPAKWPSTQAC
jgi:hypothetical protein